MELNDINNTVISGWVASDPIPGKTQNGGEVTNFDLGFYNGPPENIQEGIVHCVGFGKLALSLASRLEGGDRIVIAGHLKPNGTMVSINIKAFRREGEE